MTSEFTQERLRREMLPGSPMDLFCAWFDVAKSREPWEGRSVVLSTVSAAMVLSSRVVLMRGMDDDGFRIYTNYDSRKGQDLVQNPNCALVFWWPTVVRQVRVEGIAQKLPPSESDAYFATRPRESQLGAWASPQSTEIESRCELDAQAADMAVSFTGKNVPRPPNWGGYIVRPQRMEFWQGGKSRLHDRFCYTKKADSQGWSIARLAP